MSRGTLCLRQLDRAATSLAGSPSLKHRRSTSCTGSRQSKALISYHSPPSHAPSLLRPGRIHAKQESERGGGSTDPPATPAGNWKRSPRENAKSLFQPSRSYNSEGARTSHTPTQAEFGNPTGPTPQSPTVSFVLTPRIAVTPEYGAVGEDDASVWAAVQLSAHGYGDAVTDDRPSPGE